MGPLVDTDWLALRLEGPGTEHNDLVVVDTRWYLGRPGEGKAAYLDARIPGALHLDVDADLSSPPSPALGRHPLPDPHALVRNLALVGIGRNTWVVAYDDAGGAIAARLWWLLRWLGHGRALVLDGGIEAWKANRHRVERGTPRTPQPTSDPIPALPDSSMVMEKPAIPAALGQGLVLLDARAPARFRGDHEPVDPRPGHVPGARNAPWSEHLEREGDDAPPKMKSPEALREWYQALGVRDGQPTTCYCGSGITACLDLLGLEVAGFKGARLFPGSYSQWANDKNLPVATGD